MGAGQGVGSFVEDEKVRIVVEGPGYADALALAAGEVECGSPLG